MNRHRSWVGVFLLVMFLVFIVASRIANTYINWDWFGTLGFVSVYWRVLWARVLVGAGGGLLVAVILFVNLAVARLDPQAAAYAGTAQIPDAWLRPRFIVRLTMLVSLVVGVLAGLLLSSEWPVVLRYLYQVPFALRDPLFHLNVGFYVFTLPFLSLAYETLGTVLLLSMAAAAAVHLASGRIAYIDGRLQIRARARIHLALLLAIYLALKACGYLLSTYRLVYSTRGVVYGASYADVHASLPALHILFVLALLCAAVALANAFRDLKRPLGFSIAGLAAASLLLGTAYPALVEQIIVKPSELQRERPYIADNIAMTRAAYALNKIKAESFVPKQDMTASSLTKAVNTVRNVRLWSASVSTNDFSQQQGLRAYYSFDPITVDRYTVEGHYRETIVSGREINYKALAEPTWVNVHLKYTHGYGAVVSPASVIGHSGLPAYWLSNIPPNSQVGLRLKRPQIYFGEQAAPYAIVDTNTREFDYPSGQGNVYKDYAGHTGIPLSSALNRVAFAMHEDNFNILFTTEINAHSKALIHRDVRARVARVAPFLRYQGHPYLVVSHGNLYWILDGYTTSSYYPYSEPAPGGTLNYIRNSVKVVVNAYNGHMTFYVADPHDPVIRTYERIFPGMFHPLTAMPAGLRAHIRYPTDIFQIQMEMYSKYHMTNPDVFYNREDLWRPAQEIVGSARAQVQPYYVIIQLPGAKRAEFLLMEPFTPYGKDNMVAWVAARNDGPHYGQMVAYEFPKGQLTYGPLQVDARINEDPAIAKDLTLWSQQGSHITRGRLVTVPIANSLLYVEPIYQTAAGAQLPELRRVIVAYGKQIGFQPTLNGALTQIFGSAPPLTGPDVIGARRTTTAPAPAASPPATQTVAPATSVPATSVPATVPAAVPAAAPPAATPTAGAAEAEYKAATAAMRQGNWTAFGQHLTKLGQILSKLSGG